MDKPNISVKYLALLIHIKENLLWIVT